MWQQPKALFVTFYLAHKDRYANGLHANAFLVNDDSFSVKLTIMIILLFLTCFWNFNGKSCFFQFFVIHILMHEYPDSLVMAFRPYLFVSFYSSCPSPYATHHFPYATCVADPVLASICKVCLTLAFQCGFPCVFLCGSISS